MAALHYRYRSRDKGNPQSRRGPRATDIGADAAFISWLRARDAIACCIARPCLRELLSARQARVENVLSILGTEIDPSMGSGGGRDIGDMKNGAFPVSAGIPLGRVTVRAVTFRFAGIGPKLRVEQGQFCVAVRGPPSARKLSGSDASVTAVVVGAGRSVDPAFSWDRETARLPCHIESEWDVLGAARCVS